MNFLFPLYLLGLAALSVPIFLHLRNRELKKVTSFSSLRFLKPTPIEQQERARIEHWLLLLLRCVILALLALAFARPFLRQDLLKDFEDESQQAVVLIDTSASMRRDGLWDATQERVRELIDDLNPRDEVQVYSFDEAPRLLHSFDAWREPAEIERKATLEAKLETLEPSWQGTDLGDALITAVESFRDALEDVDGEAPAERKVYLVSDFQEGADAEALGQYEWPQEVEVVEVRVGQDNRRATNATLQLLPRSTGIAELQQQEDRFRLYNDRESKDSRFAVHWENVDGSEASPPVSVVVPPGQTEILTAPKTTTGTAAPVLALEGDEVEFDNRFFQSPPVAKPLRILYHSEQDPDRPGNPLFFFKRGLIETATFKPELNIRSGSESLGKLDWDLLDFVVLSDPAGNVPMEEPKAFLEKGGRGLFLVRSTNSVAALASLLGVANIPAEEAQVADYALLGEVDRQHPYLQGFSEARFADFTKIHYWQYRRLDLSGIEGVTVLAAFDNGDPAWFEVPVGQGSLLVMSSSWDRKDSQLALSTKFIPLLYAFLTQDPSGRDRKRAFFVGDAIPLDSGVEKTVKTPAGEEVSLESEVESFEETAEPGLYAVTYPSREVTVAVNLPLLESRLAPMEDDKMEQLLKLDGERAAEGKKGEIPPAKLSIQEQESRQKGWLWLLYLVLILLLVEIVYSARCARPRTSAEPASS